MTELNEFSALMVELDNKMPQSLSLLTIPSQGSQSPNLFSLKYNLKKKKKKYINKNKINKIKILKIHANYYELGLELELDLEQKKRCGFFLFGSGSAPLLKKKKKSRLHGVDTVNTVIMYIPGLN